LPEFLAWIRTLGAAGLLLYGAAYVLGATLFVSGTVFALGAGFLFGLVRGAILISLASVAAATTAFLIARTFGREWALRRVARYPQFAALDHAIGHHGFRLVLLIRLQPVFLPFAVVNYGLGLTRVSLRDYVLASWLGMLPASTLYVYLGTSLKTIAQVVQGNAAGAQGGRQWLFWAGLALSFVLLALITRIARQALYPACCIAVFAKPPRPGEVKTRLIPHLGPTGAAELAEALLQDTWEPLASLPWARRVLASTTQTPPPCLTGAVEVWLQGEGDLGARLERIARRALQRQRAFIALGADSPGLPPHFLEAAREALGRADAVLGPCEDGGFYLLGLRTCPEGLLAAINWSAATTCQETQGKLAAAGLTLELLEPWFDVDTPADLPKLNAVDAPHTRRFLERHAR
jgi:rSAM/selenodomain-associated transferase 1